MTSKNSGRRIASSNMVSIILSARNEEKYIRECIASLVKQEYDN
jgi:glycosyltransferase involved in cell wall biosynthesis